mmetsp:Transcript_15480/g.38135  ORF Transcript_15480/g.38135 Transcript_15480/m.38135 type:complete len:200 (+) Transcript_15480:615-1214(+)
MRNAGEYILIDSKRHACRYGKLLSRSSRLVLLWRPFLSRKASTSFCNLIMTLGCMAINALVHANRMAEVSWPAINNVINSSRRFSSLMPAPSSSLACNSISNSPPSPLCASVPGWSSCWLRLCSIILYTALSRRETAARKSRFSWIGTHEGRAWKSGFAALFAKNPNAVRIASLISTASSPVTAVPNNVLATIRNVRSL